MTALDRIFTPLLAGARWRDRLVAALGGLIGIALTGLICLPLAGSPDEGLLLVGSMGASAVLVFAVPTSPLAQPIPVIGGTVVSTASGVLAVQLLGHGAAAAGAAVAMAIVGMSIARCLHPPGGGCALVPVLVGPGMADHGYALALVPYGLNALVLVAVGIAFHRFSGHSYPHRAAAMPGPQRIAREDIDAALAELGEPFDVSPEDLEALLDRAERHAEARRISRARRPGAPS